MSFGYGEGKPICTDPEHRSRSVVTAIIYPRENFHGENQGCVLELVNDYKFEYLSCLI